MPSFLLDLEQNGARQQRTFDRPSIMLGRDPGADVVLNHPTVSRQHAMIMHDPRSNGYILRVLSRGGLTAINGTQVSGDVPLQDGVSLNLGQIAMVFHAQAAGAASGFGQPAGQGHYGAAPQQPAMGQGFGQPAAPQTPAAGFGQPAPYQSGPQAAPSGFGQQAGGYNQSAPPAQPSQGGFGNTPAPGGFGNTPAPGGFGQSLEQDDRRTHWDDIAESDAAQAEQGSNKAMSDFQRMQQAEDKNQKKTNPLLIVVVVLAMAFAGAALFVGKSSGKKAGEDAKDLKQQAEFQVDIRCVGPDDCQDKARTQYKIGLQLLEKKDASISHLFTGYKRLYEAKAYLEKIKMPIPADMAQLEPKMQASRQELDKIFNNYRATYFTSKQRNIPRQMAQALTGIKTYFPDKTSKEYKYATNQEVQMRAKGIYPSN